MAFCLLTTHQRTLHALWLSPNLESLTARRPQGGHGALGHLALRVLLSGPDRVDLLGPQIPRLC